MKSNPDGLTGFTEIKAPNLSTPRAYRPAQDKYLSKPNLRYLCQKAGDAARSKRVKVSLPTFSWDKKDER